MKNTEKFKTWLSKKGAVILDPTNPWEVVRFKTINGVSVVYTNKSGHLTFTGESEAAYTAYTNNKSWKAVDRKRKALKARKAKLAARDGKMCFFCLYKLGFDALTIEHLLSVSHGGSDNDNNLALACDPCNTALGNMPVVKKIRWREQRIRQSAHEFAANDIARYAEVFLGKKITKAQVSVVEAILDEKTVVKTRQMGYSTCVGIAFEIAKKRKQNVPA